jgi:hypothetical protein
MATTVRTNVARYAMIDAASSATARGHRIGILGALAVLGAAGLAGCGSISEQTAAKALVAPGRFDIYTCQEIENQIKGTRSRVVELEQLMARSAQGPGGQFVNAIAYQSEYQQARGRIKVMSDVMAERNCIGQSQWSSQRSVF